MTDRPPTLSADPFKVLLAARSHSSSVADDSSLVGLRDRWGHTPLDDARLSGAGPVIEYLETVMATAAAAAAAAAVSAAEQSDRSRSGPAASGSVGEIQDLLEMQREGREDLAGSQHELMVGCRSGSGSIMGDHHVLLAQCPLPDVDDGASA